LEYTLKVRYKCFNQLIAKKNIAFELTMANISSLESIARLKLQFMLQCNFLMQKDNKKHYG